MYIFEQLKKKISDKETFFTTSLDLAAVLKGY